MGEASVFKAGTFCLLYAVYKYHLMGNVLINSRLGPGVPAGNRDRSRNASASINANGAQADLSYNIWLFSVLENLKEAQPALACQHLRAQGKAQDSAEGLLRHVV